MWPVRGPILSSYGPKEVGYHNDGINIAAKSGSYVRAAESGVVVHAGQKIKGFGRLILIKHSNGWITAYAHNSSVLVSKGQTIKRGQAIARVGQSGGVNRPQLHFEMRKGARAVNPIRYLR
jgi:murein DD-endopeptidase MepM/ murein hydrolase activator NlpD